MEHSLEFLKYIHPSPSFLDDFEVQEQVDKMARYSDFWENCEDMGVST